MRLFRKLTKKEWKEIGEKYKDGGVHMYRGKMTYFYNGKEEDDWKKLSPLFHDEEEKKYSWEVIVVLPGVEVIPDWTFNIYKNVKTVIMADTVKRIEYAAFKDCLRLTHVKLSRELEFIGRQAFYGCKSLASIFIPPSCRKIGDGAFGGCRQLIIFHVPQHTELGRKVINGTALIKFSPFLTHQRGYENHDEVNDWTKKRHGSFPLHELCCSEDPTFNQSTIIPTEKECNKKDDCQWTPLVYLIANQTVDYHIIEYLAQIGGKEVLLIEDKRGLNAFHWACRIGDESIIKLLLRIGGRETVDTLESKILTENDRNTFNKLRASIDSALLLHEYIYAIDNAERNIDTLLDSKPSYREVTDIMSVRDIPDEHMQKLQQYKNAILEKGLESFTDNQEKVPLMRSKITVVGRGRDGKTSTINSLKGLPFQPYCKSTKGSEISEVNVHDVGIHVTSVEASGNNGATFEEAQRDPYSTIRSVGKQLIYANRDLKPDSKRDEVVGKTPHTANFCKFKCLIPRFLRRLQRKKYQKAASKQEIVHSRPIRIPDPMHEEKDTVKKKADIKLSNMEGKSIRFTIFDNGGQRVFRSIQNLFLSREGIFIVVFDMMKLFDEGFREDALEHLKYWMSSIKMDACLQEDPNELVDPTIKNPPIILVGTHYDDFLKLEGDPTEELQVLNKILIDNLPLSDLVPQENNDFVPRHRQQLYNRAQNLCFWPVDNSNPNDTNIQAIQRILLDTATNDPCVDIAQEVPLSFLRAMDELTAMSEEVPILSIQSNYPKESSVIQVMNECGVFEDALDDSQRKLEICKAILMQYQSIGHFIYFDQEELDNYCILNPQWLINMITYIVRDFKLHRFRRDFKAMAVNDGESWVSLLNRGILDRALLQKLWLVDSKQEAFLTKLMLKLGIFGKLDCTSKDLNEHIYAVPTAITVMSEESKILSMSWILRYLCIQSRDAAAIKTIDLSSCAFNLVPFYSRLVNRLISELPGEYCMVNEESIPTLLPSAANLCLGSDHKFSILINADDSSLMVFCKEQDKLDTVLWYISDACKYVDKTHYKGRLQIEIEGAKANDLKYRNEPCSFQKNSGSGSNMNILNEASKLKLEKFFSDLPNAKEIASTIVEKKKDIFPEELVDWYYTDKRELEKEILPALGITDLFDKKRIIKVLEKQSRPLSEKKYALINVLNDNDLALDEEVEAIKRELRASYFTSTVCRDECFNDMFNELSKQDYKVAHFGMHRRNIDDFIQSNLATILKDTGIQCVFLNTCQSQEVAKHLRDNAFIKNVVYWRSDVRDTAARSFCEAFYYHLCMNRRAKCQDFEGAFRFAKKHIERRKFVIVDPKKKEEARQEVKKMESKFKSSGFVAAGIPDFCQLPSKPTFPDQESTKRKKRKLDEEEKCSDVESQVESSQSSDLIANQASAVVASGLQSNADRSIQASINQTNSTRPAEVEGLSYSSGSNDILNSRNHVHQKYSSSALAQSVAHAAKHNQSMDVDTDVRRNSSANQNSRNSKAKIPKEWKCELLCEYKFQCGNIMNQNCRFISYEKRGRNLSPDIIVDIGWQQNKSHAKLKKCEKCDGIFCNVKRVQSQTQDGNKVLVSCMDAHKCPKENKNEPDITITVPNNCSEYRLSKKDTRQPEAKLVTSTVYCKPCRATIDERKSTRTSSDDGNVPTSIDAQNDTHTDQTFSNDFDPDSFVMNLDEIMENKNDDNDEGSWGCSS